MALPPPRRAHRRQVVLPKAPTGFIGSAPFWFILIMLSGATVAVLYQRFGKAKSPAAIAEEVKIPETPVVVEQPKVVVTETPTPTTPVTTPTAETPTAPKPVVKMPTTPTNGKEEEIRWNRLYRTVSNRIVPAHVGEASALQKKGFLSGQALRVSPDKPLPVPAGNATLRAELKLRVEEYWASIDPNHCVPHPDAENFPGAVLEPADRVITAVSLPTNRSRWHSTGLYAAPGERITFRIPAADIQRGLVAHIGCHNDNIGDSPKRENWHRFPVITNSIALNKRTVELANPFGGPIYIDLPGNDKNAKSRELIRVEIVGAVEAPIFILGKTTRAEWDNSRLAPAPWGELVCDNMVLSVPSKLLRELPYPEDLMKTWMEIVEACDWLAAWGPRHSAERIVPDAEISIGWMHSGYPIKCYTESAPDMVNLKKLKTEGNWGFYHELGHNHQSSLWTYSGYTEVTCNLFALYCMDRISNRPLGAGHGDDLDAIAREMALDPKSHSDSAFHLLSQYYFPLKQYGWKSLHDTFEELSERHDIHKAEGMVKKNLGIAGREITKDIEALEKEKHQLDLKIKTAIREKKDDDKTAAETRLAEIAVEEKKLKESMGALSKSDSDVRKKDIFVRIWSKHANANLGPYFACFDWPYTDSMKTMLTPLKAWMPPNFPPLKADPTKVAKTNLFGSKNESMAGAEEKVGDNNAANTQ